MRPAVRVVLLAAAVAVCCGYLAVAALTDQVDFGVYRAGGAAAFSGHGLYTLRVTPIGLPFTYPPVSALTFVPLSWPPLRVAQALWMLISLVGLWQLVRLTLGRFAAPAAATSPVVAPIVFVLVALSDPLRVGLGLGQINVVVALLVVADLCGVLTRLPRGLMIGVAAALKLTPLFLVAYLLAVRRTRDAAVAAGTFVAVTVAAFALNPAASTDFWLRGYFADPTRIGGIGYVSNQSINGVVVRLVGGPEHARVPWILCATLLAVIVLSTVRRIEPARPWLAEAMAMATMLAVSPVSWVHHWIFVLPLLVSLTRLRSEHRSRPTRWFGAALMSDLLLRVIWFVPNTHDREYQQTPIQFLLGNSDIILLLATLAALVWMLRAAPHAAPSS